MNDSFDDDDVDNDRGEPSAVGYGKPPVQHRFKRGQSGNPRGRPRRNASFEALFSKMLISTTPTNINGKRRHLTVIEVAVLRAMKEILTGSPRALERWLTLIERFGPTAPVPGIDIEAATSHFTDEQLRILASIRLPPFR